MILTRSSRACKTGDESNRCELSHDHGPTAQNGEAGMKTALIILALLVAGLSANAQLDLAQAVDATNLVWNSGGDAVWIAQTNVTHDGMDAAQSGTISTNQESWLRTTVTGPGAVAFWWKVSSRAGFDFLALYVGGILQTGRISGQIDWQHRFYLVPESTQELRWRFVTGTLHALGQDRAWVDEVVFVTNSGPPVIVVQPRSQTVVAGVNITLGVGAGGDQGLTYQWLINDTNAIGGATNATLTLSNLQTTDTGLYSVVVSNLYGSVTSQDAVLTVTSN